MGVYGVHSFKHIIQGQDRMSNICFWLSCYWSYWWCVVPLGSTGGISLALFLQCPGEPGDEPLQKERGMGEAMCSVGEVSAQERQGEELQFLKLRPFPQNPQTGTLSIIDQLWDSVRHHRDCDEWHVRPILLCCLSSQIDGEAMRSLSYKLCLDLLSQAESSSTSHGSTVSIPCCFESLLK